MDPAEIDALVAEGTKKMAREQEEQLAAQAELTKTIKASIVQYDQALAAKRAELAETEAIAAEMLAVKKAEVAAAEVLIAENNRAATTKRKEVDSHKELQARLEEASQSQLSVAQDILYLEELRLGSMKSQLASIASSEAMARGTISSEELQNVSSLVSSIASLSTSIEKTKNSLSDDFRSNELLTINNLSDTIQSEMATISTLEEITSSLTEKLGKLKSEISQLTTLPQQSTTVSATGSSANPQSAAAIPPYIASLADELSKLKSEIVELSKVAERSAYETAIRLAEEARAHRSKIREAEREISVIDSNLNRQNQAYGSLSTALEKYKSGFVGGISQLFSAFANSSKASKEIASNIAATTLRKKASGEREELFKNKLDENTLFQGRLKELSSFATEVEAQKSTVAVLTEERQKSKTELTPEEQALVSASKEMENELKERIDQYRAHAPVELQIAQNGNDLGMALARSKNQAEDFKDNLFKAGESTAKFSYELELLKIKEKYDPMAVALEAGTRAFSMLSNAVNSLVNTIRATQQEFGVTAGAAIGIRVGNFFESLQSYAGSIASGFEKAVVTSQQIQSAQQAFQTEFGGVLTKESAKEIAERSVREGITVAQQAMARRVFIAQTGGVAGARSAESNFMAEFERRNLTQKDAMEAISKYSELVARNGGKFASSIARAAADAKRIGFDLQKSEQFGDNLVNNFEGFLEGQAELGAMGFGFDTSRLAEIAAGGNVEALKNELQSQLRSTGMDLKNLNRPQRLALEQGLGMSMADINKLVAGEGSGEDTMEELAADSNKVLSNIANLLQISGTALGAISGVLSGAHTVLLFAIAKATAATALNSVAGFSSMFAGPGAAMAGKFGGPALGGLVGIGTGTAIGTGMGASAGQSAAGSTIGAILGGLAGAFLLPFPGGAMIGASLGGMAGGAVTGGFAGDDVVSRPGYGNRKLVTPTATVALNNEDNIVAYADDMISSQTGINMLSKGAIAGNTPQINMDLSKLEQKFDQMANSFSSQIATSFSNMSINMDGIKVAKILHANTDSAQKIGVFNIQSRATL